MMNAGGSAVERLIFGTTAAGAAIGACVTTMSAATIFGRKGPLCPRPLPLGGVLPRFNNAPKRLAAEPGYRLRMPMGSRASDAPLIRAP
jgi:hypothetical protein